MEIIANVNQPLKLTVVVFEKGKKSIRNQANKKYTKIVASGKP